MSHNEKPKPTISAWEEKAHRHSHTWYHWCLNQFDSNWSIPLPHNWEDYNADLGSTIDEEPSSPLFPPTGLVKTTLYLICVFDFMFFDS